MPVLEWPGKAAVARVTAGAPAAALEEVPELCHGAADSGNLIVQGDNLHVLAALLPRHAGQVRCAYIDPPYNTGRIGSPYDDNVDSPAIRRWLADTVGPGAAALDRHDRWLCMMYPWLVALHGLLRPDGVLFASIDEAGVAALDLLLAEVFGRGNRVAQFTWQRKKKVSHLDRHVRRMSEFVVCYARDRATLPRLFGETCAPDKRQPLVKRTSRPRILHFAPGMVSTSLQDGEYPAGFRGRGGTGLNVVAPFAVRSGVVASALCVDGRFVWTQRKLDQELAAGSAVELSRRFALAVRRHDQSRKTKPPCTLLVPRAGIGTNEYATAELAAILGREPGTVFPNPKPVSLVQHLVRAATHDDPEALVFDGFAGSGTTAHAVLRQNAEDGGRRRFILVEMDAWIAREVTAERVRRVCAGYVGLDGGRSEALGGGFRFCRLGGDPASPR